MFSIWFISWLAWISECVCLFMNYFIKSVVIKIQFHLAASSFRLFLSFYTICCCCSNWNWNKNTRILIKTQKRTRVEISLLCQPTFDCYNFPFSDSDDIYSSFYTCLSFSLFNNNKMSYTCSNVLSYLINIIKIFCPFGFVSHFIHNQQTMTAANKC